MPTDQSPSTPSTDALTPPKPLRSSSSARPNARRAPDTPLPAKAAPKPVTPPAAPSTPVPAPAPSTPPILGPDGQPLPVLRRRVFLAQDEDLNRGQHARHHYPPRDRDSRRDGQRSGQRNGQRDGQRDGQRNGQRDGQNAPKEPPRNKPPSSQPPSARQPQQDPTTERASRHKRPPQPPTSSKANAKSKNSAKPAPPKNPPKKHAKPSRPSPEPTQAPSVSPPHQGVLPTVNPEQPSAHATTWWGRRWIDAIESISTTYANRLVRGLKYAQQHRVRNLKVAPGKVEVQISGHRRAPYRVSIQLKALTTSQWNKIIEVLSGRAAFAASLLAGEMPEALAGVFEQCGLPLFPQRMGDIKASCSCPDWANPCKHIAAAHIAVAEALDADPFMLLSVRGRNQDQLLADLRTARSGEEFDDDLSDKDLGGVPISQLDPSSFFLAHDDFTDYRFSIARPDMPTPLLRRLGDPSHWSAPLPLASALASIYDRLSELAARIGSVELTEPDLDEESLEHALQEPPQASGVAPHGGRAPQVQNPAEPVPLKASRFAHADEPSDEGADDQPKILVRRSTRAVHNPRGRLARKPASQVPVQPSAPQSVSQSVSQSAPQVLVQQSAPHSAPHSAPQQSASQQSAPQQSASQQSASQQSAPPMAAVDEPPADANDPNGPRLLSRRVAPGSTDADSNASLLDARLEMIIPITETDSTPDGPHIARQIIWALRTHGAATARQLARRTRLKKTSVVQILQGLLAVGLVAQDGQGERARFAVTEG